MGNILSIWPLPVRLNIDFTMISLWWIRTANMKWSKSAKSLYRQKLHTGLNILHFPFPFPPGTLPCLPSTLTRWMSSSGFGAGFSRTFCSCCCFVQVGGLGSAVVFFFSPGAYANPSAWARWPARNLRVVWYGASLAHQNTWSGMFSPIPTVPASTQSQRFWRSVSLPNDFSGKNNPCLGL